MNIKSKFTWYLPGILIIISGIFLNEWTIKLFSNHQTKFDSFEKSLFLIIIQILIISVGVYIIVKKNVAIQNLLLLLFTLIVFTAILEIILSIPYFQQLSSSSPLWIPQKYKNYNERINETHRRMSSENKYNFNDVNHPYKKEDSTQIRIAVLGDSFVWGAGVPDSVIWTHRLENLFKQNRINCEILNWGISDWSTLDEFKFLKSEGHKFQFDYLIFAFMVNDPVMDSSSLKHIFFSNGFVYKTFLKPISVVFPNSVSFLVDMTNNFLSTFAGYGYVNWLNNKIYQQINLEKYSHLLKEIDSYCKERNINYSFIMTPENSNPLLEKYFDKIVRLFNENNINYYNLFPVVKSRLKDYSIRELWANPADGHPGSLVTDVYSKNIFRYILTTTRLTPAL